MPRTPLDAVHFDPLRRCFLSAGLRQRASSACQLSPCHVVLMWSCPRCAHPPSHSIVCPGRISTEILLLPVYPLLSGASQASSTYVTVAQRLLCVQGRGFALSSGVSRETPLLSGVD